jgi:hypothetical protein
MPRIKKQQKAALRNISGRNETTVETTSSVEEENYSGFDSNSEEETGAGSGAGGRGSSNFAH